MKNNELSDFAYSGLDELLNTEVMKNYNASIVDLCIHNIGNIDKVVDFGAGIGTLSIIMKEEYQISPICIEIDKTNRDFLKKRNLTTFDDLKKIDNKIELIFSSNVLEHIQDDVSVLLQMKDKLKNNGKIYLYLPAKMFLWSKMDEMVGHFRRYEIRELKAICRQIGLKIEVLHYADCLGFFASLVLKIFGYSKNSNLGSKSSLKFYDRWVFPISKFLDRIGFKFLFGKNIVLVASKEQ